jgi:murein DD-endopeptidase MepM/ murein hydrolase activator NlpD
MMRTDAVRGHGLRSFCRTAWLVTVACALQSEPLAAQTAYKYRDANGQWVFTDQPANLDAPGEPLRLKQDSSDLKIAVERLDGEASTQLLAVNECLCVVTFKVGIVESGVAAIPRGAVFREVLAPKSRKALLVVANDGSAKAFLKYRVTIALGSPAAVHEPPGPYRVPFGVGSTYLVTQAYPSRLTHVTADSEYAVDMALPDGTPVYAARAGIVINARHDSFRGAVDPAMLDQANVVEILHDDGTIALYAHLHWDSIRVRIGARVARGEYIANSGSTGFSSGPHLHFAVVRNAGDEDVSIPVEFAGLAGVALTPVDRRPITAY